MLKSESLIERDTELRHLSATAAAVAKGRAALTVVSGEAGVGKTTLWAAFIGTLPLGWRVETAVADLTDKSWAAPFAHLVAGTPGAPAADDPARSLARALAEALSSSLDVGPAVLVVDDLQFLDPVAIRALHHLVVQVSTRPLLLLVGYRLGAHGPTSPTSRAVADLLTEPWAREVRLAPFSLAGTAELIRQGSARHDDSHVRALHERAGGNPFFLTQLLRAPAGDELPWTIGEAVAARLEGLSESSNELAVVLALAGGPLPDTVASALPDDLRNGAHRLVQSGLATSDESGLRLRHGLVAEAIRADLDRETRRRAHGTLADALAADPASPPEVLAHHLLAAGDVDGARTFAADGADRLMTSGDVTAALSLYELALDGAPPGDPATVWLRRRATAAAVAAGRAPAAADATSHAQGWENVAMEPQRRAGSSAPAASGEAIAEALDAIAAGRFDAAACMARDAYAAACAGDDLAAGVEACLALLYAGEHAEANRLLHDLAEVATATGRHAEASAAHSARARVRLAQGDFAAATRVQRQAAAAAAATGEALLRASALVSAAVYEVTAGDLLTAERLTEEAEAAGDFVAQLAARMPRAMLALERDDLATARSLLDELLPVVRAVDLPHYRWPVLLASALVELEALDTVRAAALLDEAAPLLFSPFQENQADFLGLRGEVAMHAGDRDTLERNADAVAELARSMPGPHNLATADHMTGRLASMAGQHDAAARHAEGAAQTWERAGRWISAASAWTDAAREHVQAGSSALGALERAEGISTERGLVLRARKAAAIRGDAAERVPDALASLSPRERDVVLLVAERRSNREIADALYLSEKTVRNYLSAAFAKLGVSRRREVHELLAR